MVVHKTTLKVLYWNADGVVNKIHQLYDFMIENFIDVACIQETFLKPNVILHAHPDFRCYRNDRLDRSKGGVMIIIRKLIKHHQLPHLHTNLIENLPLEIICNNRKIQLICLYVPGGATRTDIQQHLSNDVATIVNRRTTFFAMGDLNAKHQIWNCSRGNLSGNILYDRMQHGNFHLLYPDQPTHFPSAVRTHPSTIDLALTNSHYCTSPLETHTLESDHMGVTFIISLGDDIQLQYQNSRPLYHLTNWQLYQQIVHNNLSTNLPVADTITTNNQIDQLVHNFTSVLLRAQTDSTPVGLPERYTLNLSSDTKNKIQTRRILIRRSQRTQNQEYREFLRTQINSLQKDIRQDIDNLRNVNWQHKIESLPEGDYHKSLWKISKYLKNKHRTVPTLKSDNRLLLTPQEKADALGKQFHSAHQNPLSSSNPGFTRSVNSQVTQFFTQHAVVPDIAYPDIDEIRTVVKCLKNSKAPGNDRIHNSLLKRLPAVGFTYLHLIMCVCMKLTYFPENWKIADVIVIPKPGKDRSQTSSYRPISLLSSIEKLLERVILRRIWNHATCHDIIPEEQCGFVSGKSTTTQLSRLKHHIRNNLNNKTSTGMILLDIERAFDRVWHAGLLKKMIDYNFPAYIIKIVKSFLHERKFQVNVSGKRSALFPIPFGVPQGAVLSPMLYNLFVSDAPTVINCERAFFADDTAFFTSSVRRAPIVQSLKETFNTYQDYYKKWKILINVNKTKATFFTRRITREIPRRLFV